MRNEKNIKKFQNLSNGIFRKEPCSFYILEKVTDLPSKTHILKWPPREETKGLKILLPLNYLQLLFGQNLYKDRDHGSPPDVVTQVSFMGQRVPWRKKRIIPRGTNRRPHNKFCPVLIVLSSSCVFWYNILPSIILKLTLLLFEFIWNKETLLLYNWTYNFSL